MVRAPGYVTKTTLKTPFVHVSSSTSYSTAVSSTVKFFTTILRTANKRDRRRSPMTYSSSYEDDSTRSLITYLLTKRIRNDFQLEPLHQNSQVTVWINPSLSTKKLSNKVTITSWKLLLDFLENQRDGDKGNFQNL